MKKIIGALGVLLLVALVIFFIVKASKHSTYEATDKAIVVSILPLKYIVDHIVENDFVVSVLVPPGSSPETFEPTPRQLIDIEDAKLVFTTGLIDFEQALFSRKTIGNKLVNLSVGVSILEGTCSHSHNDHDGGHHHNHGVDPHIWTSPRQLKIMAQNAFDAIALLYPDSLKYRENFNELYAVLDDLDREIERELQVSEVKCFFIYHPVMTYYADDYDVEQIALEQEGKEPSGHQIKYLVDLARRENIGKVLYQREFSRSTVEAITNDIGATPVEIDPLAEDIVNNIKHITAIITSKSN